MDTTVAPLASIGIDIGKEVFHLVGYGTDGRIAFRRKIKRLALIDTFKSLPPCIVGMEACLSAHFVSRAEFARGGSPRASVSLDRAWNVILQRAARALASSGQLNGASSASPLSPRWACCSRSPIRASCGGGCMA